MLVRTRPAVAGATELIADAPFPKRIAFADSVAAPVPPLGTETGRVRAVPFMERPPVKSFVPVQTLLDPTVTNPAVL